MNSQTDKIAHRPNVRSFASAFLRQIVIFSSTGCYAGYLPTISGTFGSVVGVIVFLLFFSRLSTIYYLISFVGLLFVGFVVAGKAEIIFEEKDSKKIVIDEILGFIIAMFFIPATGINLVMAFLFFRFFDTIKFFPANIIEEKLPGGYGIVLDDIVAGIYANLIMQSIVFR